MLEMGDYAMLGKQLTTEELKKRELEVLKAFHEYCEENHLRYCLYAGTLIGAVRHKGFIPWDDDIDVAMPREDYMRLIESFPKEGVKNYKLLSPYTQQDSPITYGKFYDTKTVKCDGEVAKKYWKYGVDIDIFPWDYVSENEEEMNQFYSKQYLIFKMFLGVVGKYRKEKSAVKTVTKGVYMTVCKALAALRLLNSQKLALLMNQNAMKHEKSKRICSCMLPIAGKVRAYADTDDFSERILADFEGEKFYIPCGYDRILTHIYGDYMKLPPAEKQVTHHLSNVFEKM